MSEQKALRRVEPESQLEQPTILGMIERAARDKDVDVPKMQALLEMHEHVVKRNAEAAFNAAFVEMQAEMPEIDERGQIKHGEKLISRYALFEDINKAVKPILQSHGFAIMFKTPQGEKGVTVEGVLMHRDGHRESTPITLDADTSGAKNGVQSIGSSVSYAKRYVLCALLNITTRGEDDDGRKAGTPVINEKQVADLRAMADEAKKEGETSADVLKGFCEYFKLDKIENLPASMYPSAVTAMQKRKNAKAVGAK